MELVHKAEKALEPLFKGLPSLPKDAKKALAGITTWAALIGGVLQLLAAWWLYDAASKVDEIADWVNTWSAAYGGDTTTAGLTFWVWAGIAVLVVDAIILLMAFPKLKAGKKAGWDLLFLGALINVAYGVVSLFIDGSRGGVGSLIGALIGSAIGFYLLFQVREHFGGKAMASSEPPKN